VPGLPEPAQPASDPAAEAIAFLAENPDIETVDAFIVDHNGVARGKRLPSAGLAKIFDKGLFLPRSVHAVDIWGRDVTSAGLDLQSGDGDGLCMPVPGTLKRVGWGERPAAQVMLQMLGHDGQPFAAEPRAVLRRVLDRLTAVDLVAVAAVELEFYLVERDSTAGSPPQPAACRATGRRPRNPNVYSLDELDSFSTVFHDISAAAAAQGIPTDTLITEHGPAQYEINLWHRPDAVLAADHAVMFKRAVKGVARRHGLEATFMAKPFGRSAGNGMHLHFSLIDANGRNVFDDGGLGSLTLRHAIGGLLTTMPQIMPMLAPNPNSFRRLRPGSYAPTTPTWGYENRSVSLRIPQAGGPARRIEHRVAGSDANPHLVMAAILAGAHYGIANQIEPPAESTGNAYEQSTRVLPPSLADALDEFEKSLFARQYFGAEFCRVFSECKWQELDTHTAEIPASEHDAYLTAL
jgi:glutamine synthetase